MPGSAAKVQLSTPLRFTAITFCHCSGVVCAKKPNSSVPALLIRMSIGAPALSTAACAEPRSVTSSSIARPETSPATSVAPSRLRSPIVTSAPSAARRRAIAAPMPPAPPVTSALLPSSLMGAAAYSWRPVACSPVAEPIPIIGATGAFGYGLALRWTRAGQAVVIGSRDAGRAEVAAERVRAEVDGAEGEGLQNAEAAARGPIVFLTVPFRAQSETLTNVKDALAEGQLLVDCTVPTAAAVSGKASRTIGVWQGSAAQQAEEMVPVGVTVISAFHTVSAKRLAEGGPLDEDILICGDRKADKARVARLIEQIEGLRTVNAGALEMARIVETLSAMLISINVRYKAAAGIRITGLPERDPWA